MRLSSFEHSVVPEWKSVSSDQLVYELQFISEELNSYIGFGLDK